MTAWNAVLTNPSLNVTGNYVPVSNEVQQTKKKKERI